MLLFYSFLATLSVILFLQGFFPIQTAQHHQPKPHFKLTTNKSPYDKFVLVIIDSMRVDFITPKLMPKSHKLAEKFGCLSYLRAESPTVTLPRLKAITTGAIPQFIDVLLNLAQPEKVQNSSLLHEALRANKRIVFYGDDTWLKLFPDVFARSEGTRAFFINDFYEVDSNVTKNLNKELENADWDLMILHYLGLDHIGHVHGAKSDLVPKKLHEMDEIVAKLHRTFADRNERALIVVTSDHGMRDVGGHGGSTHFEVMVPLLALNLACHASNFSQVDLAANLAVLLNLEVPAASIGRLQRGLLHELGFLPYLEALKANTLLLNQKLNLCEAELKIANLHYDLFVLNSTISDGLAAEATYTNCSTVISEKLQVSASKQNDSSLILSLLVTFTLLLLTVNQVFGFKAPNRTKAVIISFVLLSQLFFSYFTNLSTFLIGLTLVLLVVCVLQLNFRPILAELSVIWLVTLLQPFIFFTTSYLVEEHSFWYFLTTSFLIYNLIETNFSWSAVLLLISNYFATNLNQVGEKWATITNFGTFLFQAPNKYLVHCYFILFAVLLLILLNSVVKSSKVRTKVLIYSTGLVVSLIYFFKLHCKENVAFGRLLWALIALLALYSVLTNSSLLPTWLTIVVLLLKPHNLPLISACIFASRCIKNSKTFSSTKAQAAGHYWLSNVLFFAQGQDNSFASIDISVGFIGLEDYRPIPVFFQVFCHFFAMSILSHLLLTENKEVDGVKSDLYALFMLRLNVVFVVSVVIFVHKQHPFIWSVFATKIFIEGGHLACLLIEIVGFYCYNLVKHIND